jgi:hypothetical protein
MLFLVFKTLTSCIRTFLLRGSIRWTTRSANAQATSFVAFTCARNWPWAGSGSGIWDFGFVADWAGAPGQGEGGRSWGQEYSMYTVLAIV